MPSASIILSRRFNREPSGFAWCRIPTAAGARPAAATTIPTPAAWDPAPRRRRPGRWLLTRQLPDGSWDESMGQGQVRQSIITGTGFPRVFYLAYHMYRQYFPLMALTGYKRAMERAANGAGG